MGGVPKMALLTVSTPSLLKSFLRRYFIVSTERKDGRQFPRSCSLAPTAAGFAWFSGGDREESTVVTYYRSRKGKIATAKLLSNDKIISCNDVVKFLREKLGLLLSSLSSCHLVIKNIGNGV